MNAQECRTLTATRMHIAWITVYTTVHVQYQEYYIYPTPEQGILVVLTAYPAPKQLQGSVSVLFRVSDVRVGERHLAMPLYKLKASVTYFN